MFLIIFRLSANFDLLGNFIYFFYVLKTLKMPKKKVIYGLIAIIVVLIAGVVLFFTSPATETSVRTMACYDHPDNVSGKHGLPIPCSKDSDCDLFDENVIASMEEFCSPAEVGFYLCGFEDFCGDDGYCKHDCSS